MSSQKSAVLRARSAFGGLIAGLIVTLLWPIVTATFVLNAWDPDDTCARVQSSGDRVRYDFFPPRMLCSTGPDAWASATAEGVTIGLSVVLVLGVASMIIGVIAGVWSVPRVAPAASGVNFAYVAGPLPPLRVRRLRRLCGLLAVASVLSPAWMLYLRLGVDQGGSGAADPYTQIPIYVAQLLVAAALPLLALAAGIGGWVLRAHARSGGTDAVSVAVAGLVAAVVLLGLTLSLGVGAIAEVVSAGERTTLSATDSSQTTVPPSSGGVELVLPPEPPPIARPTVPSTALSAAELEQQFAAFVTQTTARFGPTFQEGHVGSTVRVRMQSLCVAK